MKRFLLLLIMVSFFGSACFFYNNKYKTSGRKIETIYGTFYVDDPAILDLIDCDVVQRMKKVDQYGPLGFKSFSRYDHSVGVWALLKKFGASREEQIAGLLHDTSHTVFSHVGDKVFKCADQKDSYQDKMHEWYLKQTCVVDILKKYNIPFDIIDHKCDEYRLLEQELPNICADRLEYNLRGGLVEGLISQQELSDMLNDITFENDTYCFSNPELAKKFCEIPLYLTEHVWGSCTGFIAQAFLAHALRRAVEIDLITLDEIHFSTDDIVFEKLKNSDDPIIQEDMKHFAAKDKLYESGSQIACDKHFRCKFRGIDPLIKQSNGSYKRLSEVNRNYKHYYQLLENKMKNGFYVTFVDEHLRSKQHYLEEVFAI